MGWEDDSIRDTPYKGLMPYEEADAPFFFGREEDQQIIVDNLMVAKLTLLYGASGVGKSSVLRAGVIHELQQQARENLEASGNPKFGVVFFNNWRDNPLPALLETIDHEITQLFTGYPLKRLPATGTLDEILATWIQCISDPEQSAELFIILDQFEEYFLYHPQEVEADKFALEFSRAVNRSDLRANFLISMREDSIAQLDRFKGRIPYLFSNRLRINHLDRDAARDAIVKPVEEYNRQKATAVTIAPDLVEAVLDQVKVGRVSWEETGQGELETSSATLIEKIEAPFLQLVMSRLWQEEIAQGHQQLRLETLIQLGNAETIVREHLEERMNWLTPQEQNAAAILFEHLVTPGGTKIAYPALELTESTGLDREALTTLLEKLASGRQRIIRPVGPAPDKPKVQRYEIFHDVLAEAMLGWRRRYVWQQKALEEQRRKEEEERYRKEVEKQRVKVEKQRIEAEKQQAKARKRLGSALLATGIVSLASLGMLWYRFNRNQTTAQLNLQGSQALAQWETSDQLATLQTAMNAAQIVKTQNLLQQAPNPVLALQRILSQIREQNQWQVFNRTASGFGQSPDGQWLALSSVDGQVSLWNCQQQQLTKPFATQGGVIYSVDLSKDGERIATASADNYVRVWSKDGTLIRQFLSHRNSENSPSRFPISLSPDGQRLAMVSGSSEIEIWDVNTGRRVSSRDLAKDNRDLNRISRLRFSLDGKQLAMSSGGTIALWNLQDNRVTSWLGHEEGTVFGLRFSPDGKRLATVSSDGTASLWDVQGRRLYNFKGQSAVFSVAFNSKGTQLATGSSDGTVRVWNLAAGSDLFGAVEGTERWKLSGHNSDVMTVSFSQDSRHLITVTRLATASLWNLQARQLPSLKLPQEQQGRVQAFSQVSFSPDGQHLATASLDGIARLWDLKGQLLQQFPGDAGSIDRIPRVFFSPDGQQLATISGYGTARLWNLNGQLIQALFQGQADGWAVGLDFQHSHLVTTTEQGVVRVWDFQGHLLKELLGHRAQVVDAHFSLNGQQLATASWDNTARLWDWQSGRSRKLTGHQGRLTAIRFSSDGQRLVTASQDGTARLWDLQGNPIGQPFQQGSPVMSVRFSPDGQRLVTTSWNGIARVWDLQGNRLAEYQGDNGLWDASFSPDGMQLATVGWRGTGQLWPVKTLDQLLQEGCAWTKDYRATNPAAKQALSFCPN